MKMKTEQKTTIQPPSLYAALKAAGVPLDSHESDLYAKVTPESSAIVNRYRKEKHISVSTFKHQVTGDMWYDLPFQFDPFWDKVRELSDKKEDIYTDQDKDRIGGQLAALLQLRRDREHKDRYQTTWGTKTNIGVFEVIRRIGKAIEAGTVEEDLR